MNEKGAIKCFLQYGLNTSMVSKSHLFDSHHHSVERVILLTRKQQIGETIIYLFVYNRKAKCFF